MHAGDAANVWVTKADLAEYLRCPYRLYIGYTEGIPQYEMIESRFQRYLIDRGIMYESSQFTSVPWRRSHKNLRETLKRKKSKAIKKPLLVDHRRMLFGCPDALRLHRGQYLPLEIKSHSNPTKLDGLELAFYSTLLDSYVGQHPLQGLLALPPRGLRKPLLVDLGDAIEEIDKLIEKVREAKKKALLPAIKSRECYSCGFFRTRCLATLTKRRDLTLLPEVGPTQRDRFHRLGIKTIDQLAQRRDLARGALNRIHRAARAFFLNRAILRMTYGLPPPKPTEIFIDIEYDRLYTGRLWLISLSILRNGIQNYRCWWADDEQQERAAVKSFLGAISRIHGDFGVYGYGCNSFDFPNLVKVAKSKNLDTKPIERLRGEATDLLYYVKDNVSFPFKRLTLKSVIVFIDPNRVPIFESGSEASLEYWEYLKNKDETLKTRLLAYAKKDVEDLILLLSWLRIKCKEMDLAYSDRFNPSAEDLSFLREAHQSHGHATKWLMKEYGTFNSRVNINVKNADEATRILTVLRRIGFKGTLGREYGKVQSVRVSGNQAVRRFLTTLYGKSIDGAVTKWLSATNRYSTKELSSLLESLSAA